MKRTGKDDIAFVAKHYRRGSFDSRTAPGAGGGRGPAPPPPAARKGGLERGASEKVKVPAGIVSICYGTRKRLLR